MSRSTGQQPQDSLQQQLARKMRYEALLRAAQSTDLSAVSQLDWLYLNGHDRLGRKLLVLIGAHLPRSSHHLQLCLLQLIRLLERLRTGGDQFSLLYVHSNCETAGEPSVQFVRHALGLLPNRLTDRLAAVYVLHGGWFFRLSTWWFVNFRASWLKNRLVFVSSLAHLDAGLELINLRIPQFVLDYDFKVILINRTGFNQFV